MTQLSRKTKETNIECSLEIRTNETSNINTGIGFFDHMLETFSKHGNVCLNIKCTGDLHVDAHHSVEDCAITIGKALKKEIFPIENVERYANATVVMDEASVTCSLDLSNRPYLVYENKVFGKVGSFDVELAEEFFHALVHNAGITCHIIQDRGRNKHHILEASFKAFAVALRRALRIDKSIGVPSTKGIL